VAIVKAERTIERALDGLPSSMKGQPPCLAKAAQEPAEERASGHDSEVPIRCAVFPSSFLVYGVCLVVL